MTPPKTMWEYGGLDKDGKIDNPWTAGTKMAPFDQEVHKTLIIKEVFIVIAKTIFHTDMVKMRTNIFI